MASILEDVQVPYVTVADYIAQERKSVNKLEFWNGKIIEVAGASPEHNKIAARICGELLIALDEKDIEYHVLNSDQKIHIPDFNLYVYPDAVVVAEKLEISNSISQAILNPLLIIEVLSPSTENYDLGAKFMLYKTRPSFREYLAIRQDQPWALSSYKRDDNLWEDTLTKDLDKTIELRSVGISLALNRIYKGITFNTNPLGAPSKFPPDA